MKLSAVINIYACVIYILFFLNVVNMVSCGVLERHIGCCYIDFISSDDLSLPDDCILVDK